MKAMVMKSPGPAKNFELKEVDKPIISSKHLLIEVKATSVNPIDTKVRALNHPFSPDFPAILHIDFAGIVKEVASDLLNFKVGDLVYGVTGGIKGMHDGALAEYIVVDANLVALMPSNLSFAEAASLPLVCITAWEALIDKLKITSGTTLLIHAGLGGVGHVAAQIGKYMGAIVHTTVSKDEDIETSKKYGADYVINYKNSSVQDYVKDYTANIGFDCIFDTVGADNLGNSFLAARLNGAVACIAIRGSYDLTYMYSKGLTLHAVLMLLPLMTGTGREHFGKILFEIKKIVESGKLKPLIHHEFFNWKQISLAHELVESKKHKGKVVVLIE